MGSSVNTQPPSTLPEVIGGGNPNCGFLTYPTPNVTSLSSWYACQTLDSYTKHEIAAIDQALVDGGLTRFFTAMGVLWNNFVSFLKANPLLADFLHWLPEASECITNGGCLS